MSTLMEGVNGKSFLTVRYEDSENEQKVVNLDGKDIPVSFAGQALRAAATSNILNPSNKGQGKISRYLGKPIRSLARFIYILVVSLLCAIPGMLYHGIASASCAIGSSLYQREKKAELVFLAKAHLAAFINDLIVTSSVGFISPAGTPLHGFFASDSKTIAEVVSIYFPNAPVANETESLKNVVFRELMERA